MEQMISSLVWPPAIVLAKTWIIQKKIKCLPSLLLNWPEKFSFSFTRQCWKPQIRELIIFSFQLIHKVKMSFMSFSEKHNVHMEPCSHELQTALFCVFPPLHNLCIFFQCHWNSKTIYRERGSLPIEIAAVLECKC